MKTPPTVIPGTGKGNARPLDVPNLRGAELDPLARMFVSNGGAALRTLLGDAHRHVIGVYPSWKTGLPQPYEGLGEQALIEESELLPDVVDYQSQAFRLRLMVGTVSAEWICDHLRQWRDGVIEAVEVKRHPSDMDAAYVAKITRARDILAQVGWTVRVRYEEEIVGTPQWQRNRAEILAHRSAHVSRDQHATFERLRKASPATTLEELRDTFDLRPLQGRAVVHAFICAGRAVVDLRCMQRDRMPVELRSKHRFNSRIRFS